MKRLWTNVAGAWKTVTDAYTKIGGTWKTVTQIYVKDSGTWRKTFGADELLISSNTVHYNIFTALGSPVSPIWVTLTINSGIVVSSTSTGTPALDTGAMPAGSRIKIINNGSIIAKGGAGGVGANCADTAQQSGCNGAGTPAAGSAGGDALNLQADVTFDNTNGNVFGGGGGAGGGTAYEGFAVATVNAGGGGGGGAGGGAGADGGTATSGTNRNHGCDGTAGTTGASGAGGQSGAIGGLLGCPGFPPENYGGGYGVAGDTGMENLSSCNCCAAGGAAGKAVDLNGNSITWLGGNNGTQVKGAQT